MNIRLTGTREETTAAAAILADVLSVREVSDWYPNRRRGGESRLGRVYVEVDPPANAGT